MADIKTLDEQLASVTPDVAPNQLGVSAPRKQGVLNWFRSKEPSTVEEMQFALDHARWIEVKRANTGRRILFHLCVWGTAVFGVAVVLGIAAIGLRWGGFALEKEVVIALLTTFTVSCFTFMRRVVLYHFPDGGHRAFPLPNLKGEKK